MGDPSTIGICALFYIYLPYRSAKFGVAVFKASLLNWGIHLPWVYVHCSIHIDLPSLV